MVKLTVGGVTMMNHALSNSVRAGTVNDVTADEVSALSGITGNVADQLSAVQQKKRRS